MYLAVTSGRADAAPLKPVIAATGAQVCDLSGTELRDCINKFERMLSAARVVILLGDRYETLAAALAATVARVPIAHIHGGEASYGSFDNQLRDAITKLAHIHFVSCPAAAVRLRDLGEEPERIHIVGAPGLDNTVGLPQRRKGSHFVVTYHPPTLGDYRGVEALLAALERFPGHQVAWTGVNADPGSEYVRGAFRNWGRASMSCDLPVEKHLLLVLDAACVVGNSSAGLIEAPTLGVPTVNVGPRQDGRFKGPSVFDCPEDPDAIEAAMRKALEYEGPYHNPYGEPGASQKIADILASTEIDMVKRWSL